ncbi:MAG: DUF2782 domain-containing protein [Rhodanobacter sp.]
MKTVALLVAVSVLSAAMLLPCVHAQAYPASKVPPPPGMNDPGVHPTTAPPSSAAPAAAATRAANPEPLTLPAMKSGDSRMGRPDSAEPTVRVRQQGDDTVQEYSRSGQVYMVVVTPKHGLERTYMVDPQGRLVDEHGQRRASPALYTVLEWGKSKPPAGESDDTSAPAPASSR